jgi:DtxR family transcriptional regulator, Mn-dependent transcriptional regulator
MPSPVINLLIGFLAIAILLLFLWPERGLLFHWRRVLNLSTRVLSEDVLKFMYKEEMIGAQVTMFTISGALGINLDRAVKLLLDMENKELVSRQGNTLVLTGPGRETALHVLRAHRLLEHYLAEQTGYEEKDWHVRAEQFEHNLDGRALSALEAQLSHPTFDPHGDPIPSASGQIIARGDMPLTQISVGTPARIVHIEDEPETVYAQLVAEELYPGMEVHVLENNPQRVRFWANGTEHLLAPIVAANISVIASTIDTQENIQEGEPLSVLLPGDRGQVLQITPRCRGVERRRMLDLGILPGTVIEAELANPAGDPIAYRIRGALIALRSEQARLIMVQRLTGGNHG